MSAQLMTMGCHLRLTSAKACEDAITSLLRRKFFLPAAIERSVWEYFSGKAQQKGVDLSELLTDVLKRDIEISKALE